MLISFLYRKIIGGDLFCIEKSTLMTLNIKKDHVDEILYTKSFLISFLYRKFTVDDFFYRKAKQIIFVWKNHCSFLIFKQKFVVDDILYRKVDIDDFFILKILWLLTFYIKKDFAENIFVQNGHC